MTIFNLVDQEKSDIKYKISHFPDGQQSIDIINIDNSLWNKDEIQLKSRLNSFRDLELIICAKQALNNLNRRNVHLYVPYFLGARSDRKFQSGGVNYLKDVIGPIINAQNFSSVTVMDPHSDVLEACINDFVKISNFTLFENALSQINSEVDKIVLVSPDAGAYKKVYDLAKKFNIGKIITATKVRDLATGNILRTEIPVLDQHDDLTYIIVDDICDGGRTFVELAKVMKESRATAKIYLVVTHGIFSTGFEALSEYFENIFCTNSVKEIGDGTIVNTFSKNKTIHELVKQLNVF